MCSIPDHLMVVTISGTKPPSMGALAAYGIEPASMGPLAES